MMKALLKNHPSAGEAQAPDCEDGHDVLLPDVWVILSQFLDVLLDPVFSLLPNDIGNVTYSGKKPAGVRAMINESIIKDFDFLFYPVILRIGRCCPKTGATSGTSTPLLSY